MPSEDYEDEPCECDACMRARGEGYDDDEISYGVGPDDTRESRPTGVLLDPLHNILALPGTIWSAEVEIVGMGYSRAARVLGASSGSYGEQGEAGEIVCTSDATVDAEVKLSRMQDGSPHDGRLCSDAYATLREEGAQADLSCGHHVHVDASRMAGEGVEKTLAVVTAAAALGACCDRTLTALASTGYREHREESGNSYGGDWHVGPYVLGDRYKLHGSRASYAISYGNPSGATVEYRLPNGTVYADRAHAHVAIAAGLVDLASRAILDECPDASEAVAAAFARLQGWVSPYSGDHRAEPPAFSEADGAAFLTRYLHLHHDSLRALALAADDAPTSKQHRDVWHIAASQKG